MSSLNDSVHWLQMAVVPQCVPVHVTAPLDSPATTPPCFSLSTARVVLNRDRHGPTNLLMVFLALAHQTDENEHLVVNAATLD